MIVRTSCHVENDGLIYKGDGMKIFVSWSGALSKKVAQELKKWLPCIIQSVDVFYSPEDIEKGENWDSKISSELSQCNYGIVCLTSENTMAPWINFEAGAIAKTLESRVSALMVDIKTSEIQGPLKRYQATKLEKEDMWQLISDINRATDSPLEPVVLEATFNAIWDTMYSEIGKVISDYKPIGEPKDDNEKMENGEAIEEILQLVRKQNVLLSSPEQLLPPAYYAELQQKHSRNNDDMMYEQLLMQTDRLLTNLYRLEEMSENNEMAIHLLRELHIDDFVEIILHMTIEREYNNPRLRKRSIMLREKYVECRKLFG